MAPNCLEKHDYSKQTWGDLCDECKIETRAALERMDTGSIARCAYCESPIRTHAKGHIEHFSRRHDHPQLTFEWNNLFLSCSSHTHCGHFKDSSKAPNYRPDQLIKPDEDDASLYLHFHSSGEVTVRNGLNSRDAERAQLTIDVLGLNDWNLRGARSAAVKPYLDLIRNAADELATWDEADRMDYLQLEISESREYPYATTISHFLMPR